MNWDQHCQIWLSAVRVSRAQSSSTRVLNRTPLTLSEEQGSPVTPLFTKKSNAALPHRFFPFSKTSFIYYLLTIHKCIFWLYFLLTKGMHRNKSPLFQCFGLTRFNSVQKSMEFLTSNDLILINT